MSSKQQLANGVAIQSFPLMGVLALAHTICAYLEQKVDSVLGEDGTVGIRQHIYGAIVCPAAYELIEPLEKLELSRDILRDDEVFAKYIPHLCYPEYRFPQVDLAMEILKKTGPRLGLPSTMLTDSFQNSIRYHLTTQQLIGYGGIDPSIDTECWVKEDWLAFIREHPLAPRRSLIFTAMAMLASQYSCRQMGARLSSVVGVKFVDIQNIHDSDDYSSEGTITGI